MSDVLTQASEVKCPHGGTARVPSPVNRLVTADGARVLVDTDVHVVAGCPFTIGTSPSPCVRVEWTAVQRTTSLQGNKALTNQSVGTCYSAQNAPQGLAIKVNRKRARVT